MTDHQFEEQIDRICRNDKEGLRSIYEDYHPLIFSVAAGILGRREDAEDITSEFFIRLWNTAHKYRRGRGHRAWLITIAHNMTIDYQRKHSREQAVEEIPEVSQMQWDLNENQILGRISLEQALKLLGQEERQIINLKIMGELTFREIAAIIGSPLGTVTWRYQSAIKKLKRCGYDG